MFNWYVLVIGKLPTNWYCRK